MFSRLWIKRWYNAVSWTLFYGQSRTKFVIAVLNAEDIMETPFVNKSLANRKLDARLKAADTHLKRIQMVRSYFSGEDFRQALDGVDDLLKKDDIYAGMFITKGEEYSDALNYRMALRCLNAAASFADTQDTLGKVYRNRSAVLFEMDDWEGCLSDTEMGLEMDCAESMISDLNARKLKCEVLRKHRKSDRPGRADKHEYRDNVLFQLHKGQNDKLLGASSVVEMKYDEKRGRGLFVKEDVDPGCTLLIEDPYVKIVNGCIHWVFKHCWACLAVINGTLACDTCVFAVYCSEQCRSDDWKQGHAYECACLPYFHGAGIKSNFHLCYKALCKAGPKELYRMYHKSTLEDAIKTKGVDPRTGIFDSTSYLAILNQASHIKDEDSFSTFIWIALSFTEILDYKTDFFSGIPPLDKCGFKTFVASIALHHNLSIPFNCLALTESILVGPSTGINIDVNTVSCLGQYTSNPNIPRIYKAYVGGVYPVMSLMNHSCDPTIGHVHLTNGKIAMMTLKRLKAGDEALFTYGAEFGPNDYKSRQECLFRLYRFRCRCLACKFRFPIDINLSESPTHFRCPNCTDGYSYYDFEKCTLKENRDGFGTCPLCSSRFDVQYMYDEVQCRATTLLEVDQLMLNNKTKEGIMVLLDYIKYLQRKVSLPSYEIVAADRTLTKCYNAVMED